jgi:hypothetical protein
MKQCSFAFSWINKRLDNIKMHGGTVKKNEFDVTIHNLFCVSYIPWQDESLKLRYKSGVLWKTSLKNR